MVGEKIFTNGFGVGKADKSQFYIEQNKENQADEVPIKDFQQNSETISDNEQDNSISKQEIFAKFQREEGLELVNQLRETLQAIKSNMDEF